MRIESMKIRNAALIMSHSLIVASIVLSSPPLHEMTLECVLDIVGDVSFMFLWIFI